MIQKKFSSKSFVYTKKTPENNPKSFVKAMNNINNTFLYDLNSFIQKALNK